MTRKQTCLSLALLAAIGTATPAFAQTQEQQEALREAEAVEAEVIITDQPGNSISSNYSVDFDAMDGNGDGSIVRAEARGNPDLMREFHVVDLDDDGRLSRAEMKDWIDPLDVPSGGQGVR